VISVYDCWFLRHPELASPLVRRAGRTLRRAVGRGAWIHASSDATAIEVRTLLGTDRVATVHLGPPPSPPVPAADHAEPPPIAGRLGGRPFVLCIATEERRKAVPIAIAAFEHVARDHADTMLVLAGARGDDSAAVTAAIERCGGEPAGRVLRLGVVDDASKQWLVRHAAVLAYPSLDEGFGFPVLEAQAAGTPVVASSVGSIPEVAGDAARLVTERDPIAFAEAIHDVMTSGAERLGLIEAGYRNVGRFSWATTADGMVALYHAAREESR
jgi:glycosyltransferase involved in cell wall biosynthesis